MAIDVVVAVRSRRTVDIVVKQKFDDQMPESVRDFIRRHILTIFIELLGAAVQLNGKPHAGDIVEVPMEDGFYVTTRIVFKKHADLVKFLGKTEK